MKRAAADAYLRRIGADRPVAPDAAALRTLHRLHLETVPFENLSIHLGEEIVLAEEPLWAKIVEARRGGFCYELNGSFAALLRALGYRVDLLGARTSADGEADAGGDGKLSILNSHMTLRVEAEDGSRWLADVGFGKHSTYPLALDARGEQRDPGGLFRIQETDEGDLDVLRNGRLAYRVEQRPRALADFLGACWYNRTSPDTHFTQSLICSRLTEDGGRISLSGRNLVTTGADGTRVKRALADAAEVLEVYRTRFGMELEREPRLKGA